jgi:hypothetical protein
MSGYGLPDPYGLLDGQPQMQIFVLENAKIIMRPTGGWFLPAGGKQVSFSYKYALNEWPLLTGKIHDSTLGMFAGNGAPNSNTAFCIVSRFPLQEHELTGNDDASQFVSRLEGEIEKAVNRIAGASVNYGRPDFCKPYIPLILPTPLYGILTSEEWAQGAKIINTAWRDYYDPQKNHLCAGNNFLYGIGAAVVMFLLAGLSSIDGPAGSVFTVFTIIYLVGFFVLVCKHTVNAEVNGTQPMWTALREAHENAFGRKVRITWTPGASTYKKNALPGQAGSYIIDKFCVEILQSGGYNGQQQIVMGQQPMLRQQVVMGQQQVAVRQQSMPQQQIIMGQQSMPQQQIIMGQQPMFQQQVVMGQQNVTSSVPQI